MTAKILRVLYTGLFTFLLPVIFLRLWIKGAQLKGYRQRWPERVGCSSIQLDSSIWVHAVSVGEAIAAVPLVKQLQAQHPALPIVITTMTPTGSDRVKAAFKSSLGKDVFHVYVPYDIPFAIKQFLKRMQPKLLILMETEIWPNLISVCDKQDIPMMIANGRLSPRSLKHYKTMGFLIRDLVQKIHIVGAQSKTDQARFIEIGMPSDSVVNTGNIKFDMTFSESIIAKGHALRSQLGKTRRIWIAASTHEGEEAIVLTAYQKLKVVIPDLLLLLVPRHPERFEKVAQLCRNAKLNVVKRTEQCATSVDTDVFLGDTMGEMGIFYAASDIAFVGGSLAPIGGHNLLEPAALGLPVITGPHLHNFVYISKVLFSADAAILVSDEQSLVDALKNLFENPDVCQQQGQRGLVVVNENKGAIQNLVRLANQLLLLKQI